MFVTTKNKKEKAATKHNSNIFIKSVGIIVLFQQTMYI